MKVKAEDIATFDRELLAVIDAQRPALKVRPERHGITVRDYSESHGVGNKTARARLVSLEAGGLLVSEMMMFQNHPTRVWTRAGKPKAKK